MGFTARLIRIMCESTAENGLSFSLITFFWNKLARPPDLRLYSKDQGRLKKNRYYFDFPLIVDALANDEHTLFRFHADQDQRYYLEFWGRASAVDRFVSELRAYPLPTIIP
jgi:hypothetical protein